MFYFLRTCIGILNHLFLWPELVPPHRWDVNRLSVQWGVGSELTMDTAATLGDECGNAEALAHSIR